MNLKNISKSWYFLFGVIVVYLIFFFLKQEIFFSSLSSFWKIFTKIIPTFVLVFILMAITNYFITPQFILRHLKEKKIRKWFFVILGGVLSTGPIYMWYPLLADLKEKGFAYGLIACFLYNRAIKIPLIPIMLIYFSWQYVLILGGTMIGVSIIQGVILNKIMEVK